METVITLWFIGHIFTAGMISKTINFNNLEKWVGFIVAFFIWPYILGTVAGNFLKLEAPDNDH